MTYLLIGDLHLTDKPRDAYRFKIFPWIRQMIVDHKVTTTIIMGDLTDQKDKHSAKLVRAITDGFLSLYDEMDYHQNTTYILKGNHDYIDPVNPFFNFLNYLPGVTFVSEPTALVDSIFAIPHTRSEDDFIAACKQGKDYEYLFIHQTITGAVSESGAALSGFSPSAFLPWAKVYAGDIHKPQTIGQVTYVGSPYSIRFGDNFTPRCILLGDKEKNLYFDCPRKWGLILRSPDDLLNNKDLIAGDQVKLTFDLTKEEMVDWKVFKLQALANCKKLGLEVFGVGVMPKEETRKATEKIGKNNSDVLVQFCNKEKVGSKIRDVGNSILECSS